MNMIISISNQVLRPRLFFYAKTPFYEVNMYFLEKHHSVSMRTFNTIYSNDINIFQKLRLYTILILISVLTNQSFGRTIVLWKNVFGISLRSDQNQDFDQGFHHNSVSIIYCWRAIVSCLGDEIHRKNLCCTNSVANFSSNYS